MTKNACPVVNSCLYKTVRGPFSKKERQELLKELRMEYAARKDYVYLDADNLISAFIWGFSGRGHNFWTYWHRKFINRTGGEL